jgi:PKD repeat protein
VNNEPNLKITSKNMHCCEFNDPDIHSKLIIDSINGVITYKWISFNGDHTAVELEKYKFNPSYNINSPVGKWQLTAAVSSNGCLSNPDTSLLVIHPKPKPDFSILPNSILPIDSTHVKFQNITVSNSDTLKFIWDLGEGILSYDNNKVDQNYNYPAQNKNYQIKLTAISKWGCSDSLIKTLSISVNSNNETIYKTRPFYIDNNGIVHDLNKCIKSIGWYTLEGAKIQNTEPNIHPKLPVGIYLVSVLTIGGRQFFTKQVITED